MQITGGCHCGNIRYEAKIDPEKVSVCHCNACQRLTGSPFRVSIGAVPRAAIRVTGTPVTYTRTGDSGRARHQQFCGTCGSPVFVSGDTDDLWGIRWGSVDQRADLPPTVAKWCSEAAGWIGTVPTLPGRTGD